MATKDISGGVIYNSQTQGDAIDSLLGIPSKRIATVVAATGNNANVLLDTYVGIGPFSRGTFLLEVEAAATDVGDTLDVFIDSTNDDDTPEDWVNIIHFSQVLGNGGVKRLIAATPDAAGFEADVTTDLAAGATPRPLVGHLVRVRYTTAGDANANLSFTFHVHASFRH